MVQLGHRPAAGVGDRHVLQFAQPHAHKEVLIVNFALDALLEVEGHPVQGDA